MVSGFSTVDKLPMDAFGAMSAFHPIGYRVILSLGLLLFP